MSALQLLTFVEMVHVSIRLASTGVGVIMVTSSVPGAILVKTSMNAGTDTTFVKMVDAKIPKGDSLVSVRMATNLVLMVPIAKTLMSVKKTMLVHHQDCVKIHLELLFVLVLKDTNLDHLEETA